VPASVSAPANGEGADDEAITEPQIDDHMFSPSGEPILRPGYILRIAVSVGDKIEINPLDVQISTKSEITLPLIGKVDCAGLTINGLRSRLTNRYGEFFRSPEISADFVVRDPSTSPWGRVLVQGRVRQEGWISIPATRYLMVSDAIQKAGGFGQFARKDNIRVSRRRKDGTIEFFKINLEEIGKKGKTENDMLLKSGDVVYVYESSI
jgi:polysaccharide export outer membrane protein